IVMRMPEKKRPHVSPRGELVDEVVARVVQTVPLPSRKPRVEERRIAPPIRQTIGVVTIELLVRAHPFCEAVMQTILLLARGQRPTRKLTQHRRDRLGMHVVVSTLP